MIVDLLNIYGLPLEYSRYIFGRRVRATGGVQEEKESRSGPEEVGQACIIALKDIRLIVSDGCMGPAGAAAAEYSRKPTVSEIPGIQHS